MIRIASPDAAATAAAAAQWIASALREAAAARGTATLALSGGRTPALMIEALTKLDLPWALLRVLQVDERIVPRQDVRLNASMQRAALVQNGPLPASRFVAMPVDAADLERAAAQYAQLLGQIDVVHLGLGDDGHTASLVPGDPLLGERDRLVGISGLYQGTRRMTLTFPAINAARRLVWLVTGQSKTHRLRELLTQAGNSPALQVRRGGAVVFADDAAAGEADAANGVEPAAGV